jgi:hypothetical protein
MQGRWQRQGRAACCSLALALSALILFGTSWAQAARVALLQARVPSAQVKETLFRLQGELLALGVNVEIVRGAKPGSPFEDLQSFAAERDLDAALQVIGETKPRAVEIWIFGPAPSRSEVANVTLVAREADQPQTLAIRSIEVLRSRLLELDLAARARSKSADTPSTDEPAEQKQTKPAEPPTEQREPRGSIDFEPPRDAQSFADAPLGVGAGALVLANVDGVPAALLPLLRAEWALSPVLATHVTVAGFGTRPNLETDAGSARVTQQFGLLGLCYCASREPGLQPSLGVSTGVLRTALDGQAAAPRAGHSVTRWSWLVDANAGLRFAFADRYHLTLAAHLHWATPQVAIHFVDARVASTGQPNLLSSLTLGAWL